MLIKRIILVFGFLYVNLCAIEKFVRPLSRSYRRLHQPNFFLVFRPKFFFFPQNFRLTMMKRPDKTLTWMDERIVYTTVSFSLSESQDEDTRGRHRRDLGR